MPKFLNRIESFYHFLASKQLALILFLLLCLSLIPGTLAKSDFHASGASRAVIACMALNLVLCTVSRIRTLAPPVLVMHLGAIITLGGGIISALGFIATINIYEGTGVDSAYRWDIGRDVPLGFTLTVRKITEEYYPVPVRVGVLKGREKIGLFELRTGKSFALEGYTVKAEALDPFLQNLKLMVLQGNGLIGLMDTEGYREAPPDFPYNFKLVAYKNPVLKRVSVDIKLSRDSATLAEGTTEVNSPFEWNGLSFHHTDLDRDQYGMPYAGIQIVKDPGRPFVFFGFIVITIGSLFWLYRKIRRTSLQTVKP